MIFEYDDDYGTCEETFARLRIYSGNMDPDDITRSLNIQPSSWQRIGEPRSAGKSRQVAKINGWFLKSEGHVDSRDARRHIDWILDQVASAATVLGELRGAGCRIDMSCYWISRDGHGGPTVSPAQSRRLAKLELELWFDFYGPFDDTEDRRS